ncbi:MAG: biopolymer transporter ExbD [Desulfatitalea sp.]|nr:biopolymer transporter ExbD [Desulfatitalea sp.]
MKLKCQTRNIQNRYGINMTPLIDVVFLLMIFFLMTINFQRTEGALDNQLPRIGSQNATDNAKDWETVRLRIKMIKQSSQMKIYLQERAVFSYSDLIFYLDQLPDDILLVIEPDNEVFYKYVIGVYDACLKSEKQNIVFSMSG